MVKTDLLNVQCFACKISQTGQTLVIINNVKWRKKTCYSTWISIIWFFISSCWSGLSSTNLFEHNINTKKPFTFIQCPCDFLVLEYSVLIKSFQHCLPPWPDWPYHRQINRLMDQQIDWLTMYNWFYWKPLTHAPNQMHVPLDTIDHIKNNLNLPLKLKFFKNYCWLEFYPPFNSIKWVFSAKEI